MIESLHAFVQQFGLPEWVEEEAEIRLRRGWTTEQILGWLVEAADLEMEQATEQIARDAVMAGQLWEWHHRRSNPDP